MWNGRWSKELNALYEVYIDFFGTEPDLDTEVDFDTISYIQFRDAIIKSLISKKQIRL